MGNVNADNNDDHERSEKEKELEDKIIRLRDELERERRTVRRERARNDWLEGKVNGLQGLLNKHYNNKRKWIDDTDNKQAERKKRLRMEIKERLEIEQDLKRDMA